MLTWLLILQLATSPNPALTPGAARPLSHATLCATRWGLDRRHVTVAMKRRVAAAYGIRWEDHARYEFDHLIPRELGGEDRETNLWPQLWAEARIKDREENRLHRAVCAGALPLEAAQEQMRQWGTVSDDPGRPRARTSAPARRGAREDDRTTSTRRRGR